MRRSLSILLSLFIGFSLLAVGAVAQTPAVIPITGNISGVTSGGTPYAGVNIQLVNCPAPVTIPGVSVIAPSGYQLQADGTGLVNSTIWPVDAIDCNGTTGNAQYALTYIVNGTPTADALCYQPTSTMGTWNLTTFQPMTCTQIPPNPQDAQYRNLNLTGVFSINNLAVSGNWIGKFTQSYSNTAAPFITWTTAPINSSLADYTTTVQTSTAPGDQYATPAMRIVSTDMGVNDAAPAYFYHNCNYTGFPSSAPCVGLFAVSQNNNGDAHNGVWGANILAIQYRGVGLTYGLELNVFNEFSGDPGSPDNPSGTYSPVFGYAATIGGNASGSNGTAAYLVTDENAGSYWWDGLYVQRAKYAAVEAGALTGGTALQYSFVSNPQGQAQPGTNYASVPQLDLVNDWNGTGSYLETLTRIFQPRSGNSPINCYQFLFAGALRNEFCDTGETVIHPGTNQPALRITPASDGLSGAAIQVTNAANSLNLFDVDDKGNIFTLGALQINNIITYGTAPFTVSGCSATGATGSGTAGVFTLGANSCSAVITINGVAGMTAPHGWTCNAHDRTTPSVIITGENASTTTTATIAIPAGAGATDVVSFSCQAY